MAILDSSRKKAQALLQQTRWVYDGVYKIERVRAHPGCSSHAVFGELTMHLKYGKVTVSNDGAYEYLGHEVPAGAETFQYRLRGNWETVDIFANLHKD